MGIRVVTKQSREARETAKHSIETLSGLSIDRSSLGRKCSWHSIRAARQRLVLCRLMIDIMRSLHGTYAPDSEPFGGRLETFFIGLCVALGEFEEKPFSVTKIAAYMHVPRTTVLRKLNRLHSWGLIIRQGRRYYMDGRSLNSLLGMRSYRHIRRLLEKTGEELAVLDALPD